MLSSRSTATDSLTNTGDDALQTSLWRQGAEALICLAIAVMLFRTFEVEGYMISTGSMAPNLLGFHKRAVCPSCGNLFAYGVPYELAPGSEFFAEDDADGAERAGVVRAGSSRSGDAKQLASCPNCGLDAIDLAQVPRNQGDQLLVNKFAYEFRPPARWDVIVFRNPYRPSQAYVKRAVGLPGESVQIIDGDIYIDGHVSRKDLDKQRAIRIPVFDNDLVPPANMAGEPRWISDPNSDVPSWTVHDHGFVLKAAGAAHSGDNAPMSWVAYRHRRNSGGSHSTSVTLPDDTAEPVIPDAAISPVRYDSTTKALTCIGVLSERRFRELLEANGNQRVRESIGELRSRSQIAPVTDDYGYNHVDAGIVSTPVRDLMFEAILDFSGGNGSFAVEMTDGRQVFDCVIDLARNEVRLHIDGEPTPVRSARLPEGPVGRSVHVEMSSFDRQVMVAIDGAAIFEPWLLDEVPVRPSEAPRRAVRFGGRGIDVVVRSLRLYRDVHYTPGRARNGVKAACRLAEDEYFVLGDNSPVSADSRNWAKGGVSAHLLLGQPFVVHLPSRPGQVRLGGLAKHIRVPDFDRMRYIR